MKLHFKTTAIILITLFLGIILGALSVPYLATSRIRRLAGLRQPQGFIQFYEDMIQPTEVQRDTVHVILLAHFDKIVGMAQEHREKLVKLYENLYHDLKPVLTQEQIERLEDGVMRPALHNRSFQDTVRSPHRGFRFKPLKPEIYKENN